MSAEINVESCNTRLTITLTWRIEIPGTRNHRKLTVFYFHPQKGIFGKVRPHPCLQISREHSSPLNDLVEREKSADYELTSKNTASNRSRITSQKLFKILEIPHGCLSLKTYKFGTYLQ